MGRTTTVVVALGALAALAAAVPDDSRLRAGSAAAGTSLTRREGEPLLVQYAPAHTKALFVCRLQLHMERSFELEWAGSYSSRCGGIALGKILESCPRKRRPGRPPGMRPRCFASDRNTT